MQTIEVDCCRRLVRLTHGDPFDASALARTFADLREVVRRQFGQDPDHLMLIDASAWPSAPPAVRARFRREVATLPAASRIAVVGSRALVARRCRREELRGFEAIGPALAWLEGR